METTQKRCSNCGSPEIKLVPAGVSKKTNRPYNAFYSCKSCSKTEPIGGYTKKAENFIKSPNSANTGGLNEVMKRFDNLERMLSDIQVDLDQVLRKPNY